MRWTKTGSLILLFVLSLPLFSQVDIQLSQSQISLGQSTVMLIQVSRRERSEVPDIPEIEGLNIQYRGPSHSTEIRTINGRTQRVDTTVYQWVINPEATGLFEIPPIAVQIGTKKYSTPSLKLNVAAPGEVEGYSLVLNTPDTRIIQEQPLKMELVFYLSGKVANLNFRIPFLKDPHYSIIPEEPSSATQDIRQLAIDGNVFYGTVGSESLDGIQYTTLTIPMYLIPRETGSYTLGASILSFDEEIGTDRLMRSRFQNRSIRSNEVRLQVDAIPEELQNNPCGILFSKGPLQADWSISPRELRLGDPLELSLSFKGLLLPGLVKNSIPEPEQFLRDMEGFRFLSEKSSIDVDSDGVLHIKKNLRLVSDQQQEIPAQHWVYYDVEKRSVEPLQLPVIPFKLNASSLTLQDDIETLGDSLINEENNTEEVGPQIHISYTPEYILRQSKSLLWKNPFHPLFFLLCLLPFLYYLIFLKIPWLDLKGNRVKLYPWEESGSDISILDSFRFWAQERMDADQLDTLCKDWEQRMYREGEDKNIIRDEMSQMAKEVIK